MKVIYCIVNNYLYAYLEEYSYTLYFDNNIWNPTFPVLFSYSEKQIKYISYEEAKCIFNDFDPYNLLLDEYNKYLKREEYYKDDPLLRFIDDFKKYAIDDYYNHIHNKDSSLIYSAYELDEHYEIDSYTSFLNDYYLDYLKRKNEFKDIEIIKSSDDYLIIFSKNILQV